MLIGVLCEVVSEVTQAEHNENDILKLKESMQSHLERYDDGDGELSKDEFLHLMSDSASKKILLELNVDVVFMTALSSVFFTTAETAMPLAGVIELMLACRGDNAATVRTIANSISYLTARLDSLDRSFRSHFDTLDVSLTPRLSSPRPPNRSPRLQAQLKT